jgi:hypothetical protein
MAYAIKHVSESTTLFSLSQAIIDSSQFGRIRSTETYSLLKKPPSGSGRAFSSCGEGEGGDMKRFVGFCFNVRVVIGEVGGTLGFVLLVAFGVYEAWKEFGEQLFR